MTIDQPDLLRKRIAAKEGLKLKPYADSTGHLTIGYGHLLSNGISFQVADLILTEDIQDALHMTERLLPWTVALDEVRKRAFVEIVYNLGNSVLSFHQALSAAQQGDWPGCAQGFKESRWARQVGQRAIELEQMLLTGQDPA